MRHLRGFTLIELMIVIAIIAIIAAIAVPGLLASQRASNERNASGSMKTLATAENDFRTNDRDGNHVNDFWTFDLAGLYTISPPGATSSAAIKLVDVTLAGADTNPPATISWTAAGTPAPSTETAITSFILSAPKAGYWYYAMVSDLSQNSPTGVPYKMETDGSGSSLHNGTMFGFGCFPDAFSSGRQLFIVNEGNTVFKRQLFSSVRQGTASPPSPQYPLNTAATLLNPTDNPQSWPDDTNLKTDYSKMD